MKRGLTVWSRLRGVAFGQQEMRTWRIESIIIIGKQKINRFLVKHLSCQEDLFTIHRKIIIGKIVETHLQLLGIFYEKCV